MLAVAGDEDPVGLVDPDLLDRRVVEVGLQRPEAGEVGDDLAHDELGLVDRTHDAGETAALVLGDDVERQAAYGSGVGDAGRCDAREPARGRARTAQALVNPSPDGPFPRRAMGRSCLIGSHHGRADVAVVDEADWTNPIPASSLT